MKTRINLLKGDKHGSEVDYRDYLPINMTAVLRPIFDADGYMIQQPGLVKYGEASGVSRAALWNERQSQHYRVQGSKLVSVSTTGAVTELGSISGEDTASVPYSFNTQCVIANGRMWLYAPNTGLKEVTDPDLGSPIDGVWVDGYYFLTDGENVYHTNISDEFAIDPLRFATAEFMPDKSLGIAKTSDNKVVVFGRYSIEYFVNIATENFAFSRVVTRGVKAGIVGVHCKVEMSGKFYIMGGRKEEAVGVHIVGVGSVTKVSSREVDKIIGKYTEAQLSKSVLEARVEDDFKHLIVHLPNETLLFNEKVAEAAGYDSAWSILATGIDKRTWRGKHGVFDPRKGVFVYGDKTDGTIGVLDETVCTQYDEISEWSLSTPFVHLDTLSIDSLEIETIPGFTGDKDATVAVSLTYDGVSHGTEWFAAYGQPSDYRKNFILYRLGYVNSWVGIKLRGTSRSRMAFSSAFIEAG